MTEDKLNKRIDSAVKLVQHELDVDLRDYINFDNNGEPDPDLDKLVQSFDSRTAIGIAVIVGGTCEMLSQLNEIRKAKN